MLAKHGSLESTGPDLTSYTRYERHENESLKSGWKQKGGNLRSIIILGGKYPNIAPSKIHGLLLLEFGAASAQF
jgi:hypothetical protein